MVLNVSVSGAKVSVFGNTADIGQGYPGKSWNFVKPAVAGFSSEQLKAAHLLAEQMGTAAYMLVINGRVVDYYGDTSQRFRCHSIRKTFLSALYGTALKGNKVDLSKTLADLGINDYGNLTPGERRATVNHLIQSRSGVYLPAAFENENVDRFRPERESHAPGTHWFYSNWDFNTAGTAYQLMTGQNIFGAFHKEIGEPIEMEDYRVEDGSWRYSVRSWHPAYAFRMSSRDLARFGLLYLRQGKWRNRQIIPREWIQESTRWHSQVKRPDGSLLQGVGYGLMWWTAVDGRHHFQDVDLDLGKGAFIASGTGTQLLLVAPELDLVFVHRVDTDAPPGKYKSVSQSEIGKLIKLILKAKKGV